MRFRALLTSVLLLIFAGCGYVGPVLPPSPELPQAITDLTAIERGDQLVISFTMPARTTDNLAVDHFSSVDLRIGSAVLPFDFESWASSATPYELPPPAIADPASSVALPVSKTIPTADWIGKHVAIAVRTAVRKNNHYSSWSNRVVLNVIAPLGPPAVNLQSTARGVLITWTPLPGASEYRVTRKSPGDPAPVALGASTTPDFLDSAAQFDTPYDYAVTAAQGSAESLPSPPKHIVATDSFPPSVPSGVTALAAPNSIEVSWQRSPDADLKGYYIYRSVNGGSYERLGDLLTVPTFSDRTAEHGKTYRYQASAVDQKNNQSDHSAPAEVNY